MPELEIRAAAAVINLRRPWVQREDLGVIGHGLRPLLPLLADIAARAPDIGAFQTQVFTVTSAADSLAGVGSGFSGDLRYAVAQANREAANGVSVRKGHTLLANLISSGEVPLGMSVYEYKFHQMKAAGAHLPGQSHPGAHVRNGWSSFTGSIKALVDNRVSARQ